jgi:hypothetical protein
MMSFGDIFSERPTAQGIEIGDGNSLDFLRAVYRNASLPLSTRMRAAQAALVHEVPKLSVQAVMTNQDNFATKLDRCLVRVKEMRMLPPVIEHQVREHPPSELRPGNGQLKRRF